MATNQNKIAAEIPPEPQIEESRELSAEDCLNAADIIIERCEVPEWGGHIYVRTMSAGDRERYVESVRKTVGKGRNQTDKFVIEESSAKLVQQTACDKTGVLKFTPGQVRRLAAKSSKAMQRVVNMASKLNGLDDEAEDAAKNDSARETPTEGSSTGSQRT